MYSNNNKENEEMLLWYLPHEQQKNPLHRRGSGVLARAKDVPECRGHILLIQEDPRCPSHAAVQGHDECICHVPDDAGFHGFPVFHDLSQDEFRELCVEFLELIEQCFDGVGKVLKPRHNVHDTAGAHCLRELVVPSHHLLKLYVVVRIPFPEAQCAYDVRHGHYKELVRLKVAVRARFA